MLFNILRYYIFLNMLNGVIHKSKLGQFLAPKLNILNSIINVGHTVLEEKKKLFLIIQVHSKVTTNVTNLYLSLFYLLYWIQVISWNYYLKKLDQCSSSYTNLTFSKYMMRGGFWTVTTHLTVWLGWHVWAGSFKVGKQSASR